MDSKYGGVIWTNHALQRLKEREIKQGDAWATFNNPQESRYATSNGAWIYYKTWGRERIEVVAKKERDGKWIILSVWSRPVRKAKETKQGFLSSIFKKLFQY